MKLSLDINNNYVLTDAEALFFIYSDHAFSEQDLKIKLIVSDSKNSRLNISWSKNNSLSIIGPIPKTMETILNEILADERKDNSIKKHYTCNLEDCAISILGLNFKEKQETIYLDWPLTHLKTKLESLHEKRIANLLNSIMQWTETLISNHENRN
jgi:hypothetical protein